MIMIGVIGTVVTGIIIYFVIALIKKLSHPNEGKPVRGKSSKKSITQVKNEHGKVVEMQMSRNSSNADLASQYDANKDQVAAVNIASEFKSIYTSAHKLNEQN
jgi:hypothetical protein